MRPQDAALPLASKALLASTLTAAIGRSAESTAASAFTMPVPHCPVGRTGAFSGHGIGERTNGQTRRVRRERFRTAGEPRPQFGRRQIGVDRAHQRGDAGDDRRREARAQIDVGLVGVDVRRRRRRAGVRRRIDRAQTGAARLHAIAGRRRERDFGPRTAVADLRADVAQARHGDHARDERTAIGGRIDRGRGSGIAAVARGGDDEHAHAGDRLSARIHRPSSRSRCRPGSS